MKIKKDNIIQPGGRKLTTMAKSIHSGKILTTSKFGFSDLLKTSVLGTDIDFPTKKSTDSSKTAATGDNIPLFIDKETVSLQKKNAPKSKTPDLNSISDNAQLNSKSEILAGINSAVSALTGTNTKSIDDTKINPSASVDGFVSKEEKSETNGDSFLVAGFSSKAEKSETNGDSSKGFKVIENSIHSVSTVKNSALNDNKTVGYVINTKPDAENLPSVQSVPKKVIVGNDIDDGVTKPGDISIVDKNTSSEKSMTSSAGHFPVENRNTLIKKHPDDVRTNVSAHLTAQNDKSLSKKEPEIFNPNEQVNVVPKGNNPSLSKNLTENNGFESIKLIIEPANPSDRTNKVAENDFAGLNKVIAKNLKYNIFGNNKTADKVSLPLQSVPEKFSDTKLKVISAQPIAVNNRVLTKASSAYFKPLNGNAVTSSPKVSLTGSVQSKAAGYQISEISDKVSGLKVMNLTVDSKTELKPSNATKPLSDNRSIDNTFKVSDYLMKNSTYHEPETEKQKFVSEKNIEYTRQNGFKMPSFIRSDEKNGANLSEGKNNPVRNENIRHDDNQPKTVAKNDNNQAKETKSENGEMNFGKDIPVRPEPTKVSLPAQQVINNRVSVPVVKADQLVRTIVNHVNENTGNSFSSAYFELKPEALGSVFVEIHIKNNSAKISITAESSDTMKLLEMQLPALKDKLSQNGLHTESVDVRQQNNYTSDFRHNHSGSGNTNKDEENARRSFIKSFNWLKQDTAGNDNFENNDKTLINQYQNTFRGAL